MTSNYTHAIILGSTRGLRRLDPTRSMPSSLRSVDSRGTVLDWALHALSSQGVGSVTYVGGYQIQKVIEKYPHLDCRFHGAWQREGALSALRSVDPVPAGGCLVCESTTMILPQALARLSQAEGEVAVGCYGTQGRDGYVGIVGLTGPRVAGAFEIARKLVEKDRNSGVEQWINALIAEGYTVSYVDLDGLSAPISDPVALAGAVFGSKSKTLANVGPLISRATVLDQVSFTVERWRSQPQNVLDLVTRSFGEANVVVRSSASQEDGLHRSMAGHYRSVLDVPSGDEARLASAVEDVIRSYDFLAGDATSAEEVFIQPQVKDLAASGVLLTRDPEGGAPYFVINIDRTSGRSDTVTSGAGTPFETVYVSRWASSSRLPSDVSACIAIGRELEELIHLDNLDIEFGIQAAGKAYLFQVRPMPMLARGFQLADEDLEEELECLRTFLQGHMKPHPHLVGGTTLFSTMSDWNPAEMIGTTPKPLALSLYQRLVGDHSWAEARAAIGYRDVAPEPLIIGLGGRPYVDVRASLNSFLPDGVERGAGEKWVEHGLALLQADPRLHDKIEFEVALTCRAFDREDEFARLSAAGLTSAEIQEFQEQLLGLTDGILCAGDAPIREQLSLISRLDNRRARTLEIQEDGLSSLARQIRHLVEDCRRFGVVPFSVLARYAFIAMTMLRSLRSVGIFSNEEYEAILMSIPTVASQLSDDLARYTGGELSPEEFMSRYGHLRPSSYDITSPNYAAGMDLYLRPRDGVMDASAAVEQSLAADVFAAHAEEIDHIMGELGFTARSEQLRDFVLAAIPARERAKFEFMKNLDAALEKTALWGEQLGLDREEVSFLPIERVESGAIDSPTSAARMQFRREIEFAKKRWNLTCAIRLPHLVRSPDDIHAFQLEEWTPNFVSTRRVVAPPLMLDGPIPADGLDGRIVMIRAADPGYDWIFGHAIAGLVTQFGGIASHMAIRAAEFGLPAAIGCGEMIFERLASATLVELDCINQRVKPVHEQAAGPVLAPTLSSS